MSGTHGATSLIITTYNRPDALDVVLTSVAAQSLAPREVVIADDGSTAHTASVIRDHAAKLGAIGMAVRHVWHPDRGFRAAEIRNRALADAAGDYVLLIDGDCVLHQHFVRTHLAFARVGTLVQGTRVLLDETRTRGAIVGRETRFSAFERGVSNRANAVSLPRLSWLVPTSTDPLVGVRSCNMGFWRGDALRVNGFDERYVGWGREDSDFVVRMTRAGVRRRKLKFGGVVYHLWHPERPRDALATNDGLLAESRRGTSVRCEDGVDKYLGCDRTLRLGRPHSA